MPHPAGHRPGGSLQNRPRSGRVPSCPTRFVLAAPGKACPLDVESPSSRTDRLGPFLKLFPAVGIALEARKLILAALGLLLSWAGWSAIGRLFPGEQESPFEFSPITRADLPIDLTIRHALASVTEPFLVLVDPFTRVFATGQGASAFVHAILCAIWGVIVWGLAGGAIARIAAVQHATGEKIGIRTALRFSGSHAIGLIGAPLCPMIGIGFFAALCAPVGLLYLIPGEIGVALAGVFAALPLLAGVVMSLLLVGLAVGWPLMIATVAVEAEDAFDALSRSYSYVYQRPAKYAGFVLVSWVAGALGLIIVWIFAALVIQMAQWGLSFGGPDGRIADLFAGGARSGDPAKTVHGFWIYMVRLFAHGWIYSYFFTSAAMIFVLLRRDVDGAPYSDLGGTEAENQPFVPEPEPPKKADDGASY